jgi:hypothetical protein
VSNLDRSMHRSLWVLVAHSSFIEGSHTTKNYWVPTAPAASTEHCPMWRDLYVTYSNKVLSNFVINCFTLIFVVEAVGSLINLFICG